MIRLLTIATSTSSGLGSLIGQIRSKTPLCLWFTHCLTVRFQVIKLNHVQPETSLSHSFKKVSIYPILRPTTEQVDSYSGWVAIV